MNKESLVMGKQAKEREARNMAIPISPSSPMNALKIAKRKRDMFTTSFSALQTELVLDTILSYLGSGQFCFLATVNFTWRDAYVSCNRKMPYNTHISQALASSSRMDMCKSMGKQWSSYTACIAARHGLLSALKCLKADGIAVTGAVAAQGAFAGHEQVVKWCLECCGVQPSVYTCAAAARGGQLEVLQYLRERGCPWNAHVCNEAAANGHAHVLQWAHSQGAEWNEQTCAAAARGGHLALLQYLRAAGCPWNASVSANAARNGDIAMLEWAREAGCDWDERTCNAAAKGGSISTLRYLRERSCPWEGSVCYLAAVNGHYGVREWAHTAGCPCECVH